MRLLFTKTYKTYNYWNLEGGASNCDNFKQKRYI